MSGGKPEGGWGEAKLRKRGVAWFRLDLGEWGLEIVRLVGEGFPQKAWLRLRAGPKIAGEHARP